MMTACCHVVFIIREKSRCLHTTIFMIGALLFSGSLLSGSLLSGSLFSLALSSSLVLSSLVLSLWFSPLFSGSLSGSPSLALSSSLGAFSLKNIML